jgi:hypothetical protein
MPPLEQTMNPRLSTIVCTAALVIWPLTVYAQDARVADLAVRSSDECAGAHRLSYLQSRIVERAAQGIIPLRQFVWRTRATYQLDLMETVAWLDQRRALLVSCERAVGFDPITAQRD